MQVPNKLIRGTFLDRLQNSIKLRQSDAVSCFTNPAAASLQSVLQNIVDSQEMVKDNFFSEDVLQTEPETVMNAVKREMLGFVVSAGRSAARDHFDLCLSMHDDSIILLELKRVSPNTIDYLTKPSQLPSSEYFGQILVS